MAEGKIYEAISNVMKDIGAVGKNNTNTFDRYKFRGIDDVMNALSPAMVKNHVFVTPEVLESIREERSSKDGKTNMMYSILKIKYTFYTDDGSSVESVVIGEAMDRSDKSTNKAMSAAFKYACFQTFCIPTEEMQDADSESPEIGKKVSQLPKKKAEKSDEQLNKEMAESVDQDLVAHGEPMTDERVERLRAELKRVGKSEQGLLDYWRVKDFKEVTEEKYISMMNTLMKQETKNG